MKVAVIMLFVCLTFVERSQNEKKNRGKCARRILHRSGRSGTIMTPGYPNPYNSKQICLWHITVDVGYRVHLDFNDKFEVRCQSMDRVAVSLQKLSVKARPRGSTSTVVMCGLSKIANVTVPYREMWVRFQAHRKNTAQIGFSARYTSIDIDECLRRHGCQQNCINTPGSYRCSCNRGFAIAENGRDCSVVPNYKINFEKHLYRGTISNGVPTNSKVMTVKAHVQGTNTPIRYSLIRRYPKPPKIKKYPFLISRDTGEIITRTRLPAGIFEYNMIIKASVNSKSYTKATIYFNVTVDSLNIKEIMFSSPHYSVIISDNLKRGDTVLQLSLAAPEASHHVVYNISRKTHYFKIDKDMGNLMIKQDLDDLELGKNSSKRFEFTVSARLRESTTVTATVIINVIIIPAYAGDSCCHVIEASSHRQAPSPSLPKRSEFAYHRFFRQLSPVARDISKAERKFARIIKDLREDVIGAFTDLRLRSTGPIISNLPTISLTSSDKLQDIINASHCVIPKADCSDDMEYRTYDGTCNNKQHPLWGAANMPFNRIIKARYWDDTERLGEPVGFPGQVFAPSLPSPHTISKMYVLDNQYNEGSQTNFSHMMMQWGQFLDHDITFTAESEGSELCAVPRCDRSRADYESPCFPIMYTDRSRQCTMFTRSAAACQTDPKNIKAREQLNLITSYIDGSQIYGSSLERANSLRDFRNHLSYLNLDTTHEFLPPLKNTLAAPLNLCEYSGGCFAAGDLRANEQLVLASMHTMWVREHNRLATFLKVLNPFWHSEKVFQETRKIVIAELQHITYNEYLPKLLGKDAIPTYTVYDETVDATIFNSFAASAFRAGHSMVRPGFARLDENFDPIGPDVPLVEAFFNNRLLRKEGIEPFILGLLANVSLKIDRGMADGLTKHLFQQPGSEHGFDLAALNIQRGRDHGLPGYGTWRRECGLSQAFYFDETRRDIRNHETRKDLEKLYGNWIEHTDLWVAGLAEDPVPGAMVGPTFHCILTRQFNRLRDGDRFWYENPGVFTEGQLEEIRKVRLSKVICDNLHGVISAQKDAFVAATKESQRVGCFYGFETMNMSKWKEGSDDVFGESVGHWTEWINTKTTPTGSWGLFDRLHVCRNSSISNIECATSDGKPAESSGEKFTCEKDIGFYCRNIEQSGSGKICGDYRFRLLCSQPSRKDTEKSKATGFPATAIASQTKCDPSFRFRYPIITELSSGVSKEITLFSSTKNNAGEEYLYLGRKEGGGNQHRFLIQFDLRRVSRRSIMLSATLQLFLVDVTESAGEESSHALQVYPITSTDWDESNVTSVIPWNEDYLGIDSDVDKSGVSTSASIKSKDKLKWLNIDVFQAVYNWQISRKRRENYGFMVTLANDQQALSFLRFVSNSHTNTAIRPKILVCLYIPPW